jgi:hypothetical protein
MRPIRSFPLCRQGRPSLRARLRQPQNDIAIALAGAAEPVQAIDGHPIEQDPDEAVGPRRRRGVIQFRQTRFDRLEGLQGDRDCGHISLLFRRPSNRWPRAEALRRP